MKKTTITRGFVSIAISVALGGCVAAPPIEQTTPIPKETAVVAEPAASRDPMKYCESFAQKPEMLDYPDFVNAEFDQSTYDVMKSYIDELRAFAPAEIVAATNDYAIPVDAFTNALDSGETTVSFETEKWKDATFEILVWCVDDVGYSANG